MKLRKPSCHQYGFSKNRLGIRIRINQRRFHGNLGRSNIWPVSFFERLGRSRRSDYRNCDNRCGQSEKEWSRNIRFHRNPVALLLPQGQRMIVGRMKQVKQSFQRRIAVFRKKCNTFVSKLEITPVNQGVCRLIQQNPDIKFRNTARVADRCRAVRAFKLEIWRKSDTDFVYF